MAERDYLIAKAMTRNKLKALTSAAKRPQEMRRGPWGTHSQAPVPDRVARDAAYAETVLARRPVTRAVRDTWQGLEDTRRSLAASGGPREWNGGGTWRATTDRIWRSEKRNANRVVDRWVAMGRKSKANAQAIANDQRLKPRKLP